MPKHIPMPMYMPKDVKLARAYVPDQPYERLFPLNEALMKGTLFANLYQPYNRKNQ
ncbi:MAG TPA: spore coat associated protein CotJA [Epulopiscium sp.]|nr:spore coat associated protein CotJA [Candidatus Epulonipiscium sp.]